MSLPAPTSSAVGVIVSLSHKDGTGVIDSTATPGGCWFHYSAIQEPKGWAQAGARTSFDFEPAVQDGYYYRAVSVRRP